MAVSFDRNFVKKITNSPSYYNFYANFQSPMCNFSVLLSCRTRFHQNVIKTEDKQGIL